MHWPQALTLVWLSLSVPGHAYGAGKKSNAREARIHFAIGVFRCFVPLTVFYLGGFFAVWGWAP